MSWNIPEDIERGDRLSPTRPELERLSPGDRIVIRALVGDGSRPERRDGAYVVEEVRTVPSEERDALDPRSIAVLSDIEDGARAVVGDAPGAGWSISYDDADDGDRRVESAYTVAERNDDGGDDDSEDSDDR